MPDTSATLQEIHFASLSELRETLGETPKAWIQSLGKPTWITVQGQDRSRSRAIVTLLHANEPSGLKAMHGLLNRGLEPATNLGIFIASVEAALHTPTFSHRYLPHEQDMNRCFPSPGSEPGTSNQHLLARNFLEVLRHFNPEAVVDTHNTSGHSTPFAVVAHNNTAIRQVSQIFTKRLVVIGQPMGTLIEQDLGCPIVTVEFGGFLDPNADRAALTTLEQFISRSDLFQQEPEKLQILANPLRLKVTPRTPLHYATTVSDESSVTIFNTIDQMNFHKLAPGTALGWMPDRAIDHLVVQDDQQRNVAKALFKVSEGELITNVTMTIFMATTDAQIAKSDCLLYLCPGDPL